MEISASSRICTTTTRFRTLTSKFSNNICLALPSAATTPVAMLVTSLVTYTREISSGSPTSSASRPPPNWLRSYSRPSLGLQRLQQRQRNVLLVCAKIVTARIEPGIGARCSPTPMTACATRDLNLRRRGTATAQSAAQTRVTVYSSLRNGRLRGSVSRIDCFCIATQDTLMQDLSKFLMKEC